MVGALRRRDGRAPDTQVKQSQLQVLAFPRAEGGLSETQNLPLEDNFGAVLLPVTQLPLGEGERGKQGALERQGDVQRERVRERGAERKTGEREDTQREGN